MPYYEFIWVYEEDGNVEHVAEHGFSPEDFEAVLADPIREDRSDSSGRVIVFGYALDGRYACAVFEEFDESTIYPVSMFEVEE